MNEDVTTYTTLGSRGELFFTVTKANIVQKQSQSVSGGMTEVYKDSGTYEIVGHIMDDDILEKYSAAHTDMSMCDVPCRMTAPNLVFDEVTKPVSNAQFI